MKAILTGFLAVLAAAGVAWGQGRRAESQLPTPSAIPTLTGGEAPAFTLPTASGKRTALRDYRNRWLVLVFYPKANAPKDVDQMSSLRAAHARIAALNAAVLGVSMDPPAVIAEFKTAQSLPFELASDEEKRVSQSYGAMGLGGWYSSRKTVIVDPRGRIARVIDRVREKEHGNQVVQALEAVQASYSP